MWCKKKQRKPSLIWRPLQKCSYHSRHSTIAASNRRCSATFCCNPNGRTRTMCTHCLGGVALRSDSRISLSRVFCCCLVRLCALLLWMVFGVSQMTLGHITCTCFRITRIFCSSVILGLSVGTHCDPTRVWHANLIAAVAKLDDFQTGLLLRRNRFMPKLSD